MLPRLLPALAWCLLAMVQAAQAAEPIAIDFESVENPSKLKQLDLGRLEAAIVPREPNAAGHCLRIHNPQPSAACSLSLRGPIAMQKNLTLSLDHREAVEAGFEGAYLAVSFFVDGKQWFWASDEFSGSWRRLDIELGRLKSSSGHTLRPDTVFSRIEVYGRVKDTTAVKGETKARMTVWLDKLRFHTGGAAPKASVVVRESYSNPPILIAAKSPGAARYEFQYSQDPAFPASGSQAVQSPWNFFTPGKPIEPGTWCWRVRTENDLCDSWSPYERVVIPPEAHRFMTAVIPAAELAKRARPRLAALAAIGQPEVTDRRRAELLKEAKGIYQRGVPEHPGPHVPGDPRWPTWIDWYGKVAGGITGATGGRLQKIARHAMLTRDPQIIAWAKELAISACRWDPEGGSSMTRGDIGAQHLLRGLNWCYDVCYDSMTDRERETLRKIIIQRAGQFWNQLNPFRGSEANNHPWLQALALGESGLVLVGDHPEAATWAEYTRQLYLGRFLCCLGYQGDNNEGIGYWDYGLGFVIDYGDLLKAVCGINLFEHPWLSQTARFPMYTALPNAWAVSFADTGMPNHGTRGPAGVAHVRQLATRTRDPYALWYAGQREVLDGLTPKPPADLPGAIHYRHIGVVLFNTSLVDGRDDVTVALHSGRYWAGHQHADQNHFVIHAYGEKLAIDGGYYDWYGSPHFKAYSTQTVAHNTVLVDGHGQAAFRREADGRISAYFDSPGYGYVVGDASKPEIYGGRLKRFDRRLLFIKPGFVVIHDLLASTQGSPQYDWLLHAIVPIQTEPATGAFHILCKEAALHGRFLRPTRMKLDVKTGFPAEPVNRYSTNPVPKEKYFPEWTIHATPESPAAQEQYVVAMQIQRLGQQAQPLAKITPIEVAGAHAMRLTCGERTHVVLLRERDAKGPLTAGGLTTDGEAAAVEFDASGRVLGSMAIGATSLKYQEKILFHSDRPANWPEPSKP